MRKRILFYTGLLVIMAAIVLILTSGSAAASRTGPGGEHTGETKNLEYGIVFGNNPGTLTIDGDGSHYDFPTWKSTIGSDYTEEYYGEYPSWSTYNTIEFEVHIKNTGKRSFNNLRITTIQEYHKDYLGGDYAGYPGIDPGDPLPGLSTSEWVVDRLKGGEEIVLKGTYYVPAGVAPGLMQVHLQIVHWYQEPDEWSDGRIIIDDTAARLYCPPPEF